MPKALITGASGFIGSTLIAHLTKANIQSRALLRRTSSRKNLEGLDYEEAIGSIEDEASLIEAVKGVDYVFHLAGVVSARKDEEFYRVNTEGTVKLFNACLKHAPNLRRFVFASSIAAAGPSKSLKPLSENELPDPVSAYGKSKAEAENFLLSVKDKLPVSIVRPPIVYGPKDTEFFHVIKSIKNKFVPVIQGENESKNKFYSSVHVDDLCQGMIQSAVQKIPSGEIFFIAGDGILTYLEMIDSMANSLEARMIKVKLPKLAIKVAGESANFLNRFLKKPLPINRDKVNELLPDYWICSNKKAKDMLGYEPQVGFDKGMKDTIRWYRAKEWI